ncbi:MAG: hypothetical protein U5L72_08425 [Bacteroidales bacterium]|nr:hypothetical protein [Bacteroidales bacterium]
MKWKDYDPALFRSVKFEAEKKERDLSPLKIYGSDSDVIEASPRPQSTSGRQALANTVTVCRG